MSLDKRAAFKIGFIQRCLEEGLTDTQVLDRIHQTAHGLLKEAGWSGKDIVNFLNTAWPHMHSAGEDGGGFNYLAALAAAGVPFLGGAAAGALGSKIKGSYIDEEDIKKQEMIDELHRQEQLARQQQRANSLLPA